MREREKLTCQNPHHPFKQEWYWFNPDMPEDYLNSRKYCTSCASHLNLITMMIETLLQPRPTLYGDQTIKTDKQQLKQLVDEVAVDGR